MTISGSNIKPIKAMAETVFWPRVYIMKTCQALGSGLEVCSRDRNTPQQKYLLSLGIENARLNTSIIVPSIIFRFLPTALCIYRQCVQTYLQQRNTMASKWIEWTQPLLLVQGCLRLLSSPLSCMVRKITHPEHASRTTFSL